MAKGKIKAETLLRKIQKGGGNFASNIKTGASKAFSGFNFDDDGRIQMFRKREIVEPYLHPIDSQIINEQVQREVKNSLKNIDKEIDVNYEKLLPKHLVNDLYSLYYNQTGTLKFAGLDKTNKVKFDILDSINNSLIKIVTNNSNIGSFVYTQEISKFLYKKFMEMPPEQRKKLEDAMNNCNQGGGGGGNRKQQGGGQRPGGGGNGQQPPQPQGQGNQPSNKPPEGLGKNTEDQDDQHSSDSQGNEQSQRDVDNTSRGAANNSNGNNSQKDMSQEAADQMDKDLKDMVENLNSKKAQQELEKAFKEAEQKLDKLRDIGVDVDNDQEMPEEERKEIVRNLNNLDSIRASLSRLNVSKDKILKAVEKMLNGATNYFSQKCIQKDVELFEADQLLDINGLEFLHPFFRNSRIFDLSVTERKYIGKYDLYVDCSGSMGSGCGGDLDRVARIDLAKSLAIQMKELGILGDLYEFEDRPKKINNTDMSILMMAARGGTNVENVLQNILKSGNKAVVLSDGESSVASYTHKVLFIGVGTDFHYFKSDRGVGAKFVENGQCIHYDGRNFVETLPNR